MTVLGIYAIGFFITFGCCVRNANNAVNRHILRWSESGFCSLSSSELSKEELKKKLIDKYWNMMDFTNTGVLPIFLMLAWPVVLFFYTLNVLKRFISKVCIGQFKKRIDNISDVKDIIE